MMSLLVRTLGIPAVMVLTLALCACNKKEDVQVSMGPTGGMRPGMGGPRSPIGEIMGKLTRGPQSLNSLIGEELKADDPEWDKLASQSKDYVAMTRQMAKYDPPRGDKESWEKHTSAFAEAAAALEKAAGAKDKEAALSAHKTLANSCNACHQAHRGGPGGMGGFGPPGGKGGFGPPGKGGFGPPDGKSPPGKAPPPGKGGDKPPAKDD